MWRQDKVILSRQLKRNSSYKSALVAVHRVLGRVVSEEEIIEINLAEYAAKNLPLVSCGKLDNVPNSISILKIITVRGIEHHVVLLSAEGSVVSYYCPYMGKVVTEDISKVGWERSGMVGLVFDIPFLKSLDISVRRSVFAIDSGKCRGIIASVFASMNIVFAKSEDLSMRGTNLYVNDLLVIDDDIVWSFSKSMAINIYRGLGYKVAGVVIDEFVSSKGFPILMASLSNDPNEVVFAESLESARWRGRGILNKFNSIGIISNDNYHEIKALSGLDKKEFPLLLTPPIVGEYSEAIIMQDGIMVLDGVIPQDIIQVVQEYLRERDYYCLVVKVKGEIMISAAFSVDGLDYDIIKDVIGFSKDYF